VNKIQFDSLLSNTLNLDLIMRIVPGGKKLEYRRNFRHIEHFVERVKHILTRFEGYKNS